MPFQVFQWLPLAQVAAAPFALPPSLILAIIWMESAGWTRSVGPEPWIATGLMGVIPYEAGGIFETRPTQEELFDPRVNVNTGCRILNDFIIQARARPPTRDFSDNLEQAIYHYSGGEYWSDADTFRVRYWQPLEHRQRIIERQILYNEERIIPWQSRYDNAAPIEGTNLTPLMALIIVLIFAVVKRG